MEATPPPPPLVSPFLIASRALRYWHRTGKFPFDETGYDPRTGLVKSEKERARKHVRKSILSSAPAPTPTPALTHHCTDTLTHQRTATQDNRRVGVEDSIHIEPPPLPIVAPSNSDEGSDTSTERTPYWLIPIVRTEQEERAAMGITPRDYGTRWVSAYRTVIGERPECSPGDHAAAEAYWLRICHALEMQEGEEGLWTPAENNRLHLLERKWRRRKDGEDAWFELKGTAGGGITGEQRAELEEIEARIDISTRSRG